MSAPAWRDRFLAVLSQTGRLTEAASAAGVTQRTVLNHRCSDPGFDRDSRAAMTEGRLLAALRDGLTLREAAEAAGVPRPTVKYWRRLSAELDAAVVAAAAQGGRVLSPCLRLECPGGWCGTATGYERGCREPLCRNEKVGHVLEWRRRSPPGDAGR